MSNGDELARLRDEEHRAEFEIRKKEHDLEAVERAMERELTAFEHDEQEALRKIDEGRRRERFDHSHEASNKA